MYQTLLSPHPKSHSLSSINTRSSLSRSHIHPIGHHPHLLPSLLFLCLTTLSQNSNQCPTPAETLQSTTRRVQTLPSPKPLEKCPTTQSQPVHCPLHPCPCLQQPPRHPHPPFSLHAYPLNSTILLGLDTLPRTRRTVQASTAGTTIMPSRGEASPASAPRSSETCLKRIRGVAAR